MTLDDIDKIVHDYIIADGAYPSAIDSEDEFNTNYFHVKYHISNMSIYKQVIWNLNITPDTS